MVCEQKYIEQPMSLMESALRRRGRYAYSYSDTAKLEAMAAHIQNRLTITFRQHRNMTKRLVYTRQALRYSVSPNPVLLEALAPAA